MGKLATSGNSRSRTRLIDGGAAAGPPAFNPVTDLAWSRLYYAGGSAFAALGLADGASMVATNWPDEIVSNAAPLTGGTGTYQAANAAFNSKPSVQMPASINPGKKHTTTVAAGSQVALPYSVVIIFQLDSGFAGKYVCDGANEGNSGQRVLFRISAGSAWSLYMGTDRTGGTATTGIKAARIQATSGNDTLTINGSTIISGVDAGGGTWQGVSMSPTNVEIPGRIALYGVYSGDITGAGNWAAFQSWVTSTYGVSIS